MNNNISSEISTKSAYLTLSAALKNSWNPIPISRPSINHRLTFLPVLERVTEVLRFNILLLEYALSPNGSLRAWVKLNLLVSVVLIVPALLIFPVITWFLNSFTTWTASLFTIMIYLLFTIIAFSVGVAVMMLTHYAVKQYFKPKTEDRGNSKK